MAQDSSLQDDLSPFSPSDLEEVLSEATDINDESSTTQDWPSWDIIWSSDSDSEELEVVPAVTESEAVRLLAARIPPELFENILFYVNVNRVSQRDKYLLGIRDLARRNRGEPLASPNDTLTDLKRCSLVCLFWANKCREHMFSGTTLEINSYEDAEIFRRYVVGGSPRLTPVHQLIRQINVTQDYSGILAPQVSERQTSFLHLLYLPVIQNKFKHLSIKGPVPEGFNPAKLDTPHWGIPPCIVVPSSFLLNSIFLENVHLPSFHHITKYIKHFTCAAYIRFEEITWDGQTSPTATYSLPQASNKINCQRRPRSRRIKIVGKCTDSVHLALTAVMMNPNCPLHRLSDEERVWMIKFMTMLWGDEEDPYVYIDFDVSEQAITICMGPFHFVFEETSASTDRSASALSVVGMHAYIHEYNKLPANFDALVNHARTHPTIRALVLLFDSLDDLQVSVKPFVGVLTPVTETIEILLAYEMEDERKAAGVDLVKLEPNGRVDTWIDEQSEDYGGRALSLQMLQRQLKKKRWMSVH